LFGTRLRPSERVSIYTVLFVVMLTIWTSRQVEGDGEATCFSNLEDTSVPALQEWCHQLTISSRERAARNFLSHLKAFANSVRTYVQGIGDITAADRTLLREKWESSPQEDEDQMDPGYGGGWASSDPFDLPGFANLAGGLGDDLYSMNKAAPKVDPYGEPVGVTPLLTKVRRCFVFTHDFLPNSLTGIQNGRRQ
jgi:hypothetical protein